MGLLATNSQTRLTRWLIESQIDIRVASRGPYPLDALLVPFHLLG